ncbi:hypothetical protein GUJ93_ZPchr0011g27601 [Zizania palustris]|uniref:Uncharacterized protein n=1 Tax=Zizania palustris TaxID=103762 RepID=A0A8J5WJM7_ZIZPA|nr:hypothetical protein GUJ93_ZPchr0011g27601 [Zizania palustris]
MGGSENQGIEQRDELDKLTMVVRDGHAKMEREEDKNFKTSFFKVLLPDISVPWMVNFFNPSMCIVKYLMVG